MLVGALVVRVSIVRSLFVLPAGPAAVTLFPYTTLFRSVGVMVGTAGLALMVTLAVLLAEQPAGLVTTSVRPTVERARTRLNSIHRCISDAIVRLKINKAKIVAPAGPEAGLPVEFAKSWA